MDRREIKAQAKNKIKGNKWNILWPVLAIYVVEGIIEKIFKLDMMTPYIDYRNIGSLTNYNIDSGKALLAGVIGVVFGIALVAYKKYILNFVSDEEFLFNDIIQCIKEKWLNILLVEILVYIIVFLCTLVFVIPGIIMGLAYSMAVYIVVDTDLGPKETLKASREMMKGYKWDYFVFMLSFIGWIFLVPFTFGLLLIWLAPYMIVANALYYDRLKNITKK